jgi:uncharacterized RDD family membrane protein YckC
MTTTQTATPPARLTRRLLACGYDAVLIAALLILGTSFLFFLCLLLHLSLPDPHSVLYRSYLAALIFAFYHGSWSMGSGVGGQTLGMKAWHLAIVNPHLNPPVLRWHQTLRRILGGVLFLWADRWSSSQCVEIQAKTHQNNLRSR